jgi:hypothetical protein
LAEHDGRGRAETDRVGGAHDVEPLAGADFVRAKHDPNLVIKNFGGRARQR